MSNVNVKLEDSMISDALLMHALVHGTRNNGETTVLPFAMNSVQKVPQHVASTREKKCKWLQLASGCLP